MRTEQGERRRELWARRLVGQRIASVKFVFENDDTLALVTDKGDVLPLGPVTTVGVNESPVRPQPSDVTFREGL